METLTADIAEMITRLPDGGRIHHAWRRKKYQLELGCFRRRHPKPKPARRSTAPIKSCSASRPNFPEVKNHRQNRHDRIAKPTGRWNKTRDLQITALPPKGLRLITTAFCRCRDRLRDLRSELDDNTLQSIPYPYIVVIAGAGCPDAGG